MKRAPCLDCPDKGCGPKHDTCEKYQEFKKKQMDMQSKKLEDKQKGDYVYQVISKTKKAQQHKKRR